MGKNYGQIGIRERFEISRLQAEGLSIRQIAAALDRSPSSISREVKRNATRTRGYDPEEAQVRARARMWSGSRLDRDDDLRESVLALLMRSRSPEQVSGHLKREAGKPVISYESIYRFVYSQITRENNFGWRQYLPRRKAKRGWRGRKGGSSTVTIAKRRPLAERPAEAAMRRSVTFDNGTEFARRHRLHDLGVQTFFCDTYSPWQKGGVENAIGRMRRFLTRKTDLATLDGHQFDLLVQMYNNTPRKCLGYRTPASLLAEIVDNQVLHFKREFSFPPSPK